MRTEITQVRALWKAALHQAWTDAVEPKAGIDKEDKILISTAIDWWFDPKFETERRFIADMADEDLSKWQQRVILGLQNAA